jgi:uncharacterized protein (TIGR03437 family)
MKRILFWSLVALCSLNAARAVAAQTVGPQIIQIGSPLTFGGTNAPDTYSATTTFSSTPILVDNGAVKIWQKQVPTGSNGEWDVFYLQTTNGPLAGNINAYWNVLVTYTLSAPAYFDQVVNQWLVNGTPVSPLTNGIGSICCTASSNPVLPGESYYNSGFSGPLAAGVQTNWQQVFVTPYNIVSDGGINPSTANEFIFALHFTLQSAKPNVTGAISASQFGAFATFGPGSWIEIYGTNLSEITQEWGSSNFTGVNAPTSLGGTTVTIGGQSAFVDYVSPLQVNVQVPGGVAMGAQPLVVTTEAGSSAPFTVTVDAVQPGLLAPASFNIAGTQYAVALFSDGITYVLPPGAIPGITSRNANPGETITLYGVGFGSVTPDTPPGQVAQGETALAGLMLSLGGAQANLTYAGLAPNYVGRYQFNVVVPSNTSSGAAPLTFSLGSVNSTQKFSIAVGN